MLARLKAAGIEDAQRDGDLLLQESLGIDRLSLFTRGDMPVSAEQQTMIEGWMKRRAAHEPVGRIMGYREFYGLRFNLSAETLEPRPDSETLVDAALNRYSENMPMRVLDLGTGTGCLLLSVLAHRPHASGLGIDQSMDAVATARLNARNLGLEERAEFRQGYWLDGIDEKFDLILCNPPYIGLDEIAGLSPEVRLYDPMAALTPAILQKNADALSDYRIIFRDLKAVLAQNGVAIFEMGHTQMAEIIEIATLHDLRVLQIYQDLGGIHRAIMVSA